MGPRILYLGQTLYQIHGSNEPEAVGDAVSSGCFRMTNAAVIDLYNRPRIGCGVRVFWQGVGEEAGVAKDLPSRLCHRVSVVFCWKPC